MVNNPPPRKNSDSSAENSVSDQNPNLRSPPPKMTRLKLDIPPNSARGLNPELDLTTRITRKVAFQTLDATPTAAITRTLTSSPMLSAKGQATTPTPVHIGSPSAKLSQIRVKAATQTNPHLV